MCAILSVRLNTMCNIFIHGLGCVLFSVCYLMLEAWSVNSVATSEKYLRILIHRLGLGMQPLWAWMAWMRAISRAISLMMKTKKGIYDNWYVQEQRRNYIKNSLKCRFLQCLYVWRMDIFPRSVVKFLIRSIVCLQGDYVTFTKTISSTVWMHTAHEVSF